MIGGVVLFGVGSGLYIGAGLGAGPRDGLMTGIARRGASIRLARTLIEIVVLVVGVLLGGTVGVGTAVLRPRHRPARARLPADVRAASSSFVTSRYGPRRQWRRRRIRYVNGLSSGSARA